MISKDIRQSIWLSISKNGVVTTLSLLLQYFKIKRSSDRVFKLLFRKNFRDILLRPHTSDFSTFRQVFMNDEYGFELPESPRVIVDAGANIGLASLYFSKRFPGAKIFALEPDPSNFEMLVLNTEKHPQIIPLKNALWNKNTTLEIVDSGFDKWGMQVQAKTNASAGDVQGINIDYLMSTYGMKQIDLLKIDIEGAEWELFQNNFEQWLPRVKVLVIELHDNLRPGCSDLFKKAIQTIRYREARSGENIIIYNLDLN